MKLYPPFYNMRMMNEHIDYNYFHNYLNEEQGISKLLLPVAKDILLFIYSLLKNHKVGKFYTGYNWDFSKLNFIKIDNKNIQYPLYIILYSKRYEDESDEHAFTYRDIKKENKDTKIRLFLINECPTNKSENIILHELQHIREAYAKKDKNVLTLNKTNVYADPRNLPYLDPIVRAYCNKILYLLSDTEQHAKILEIYNYVYSNSNIKRPSTNIKEVNDIALIMEFYSQIHMLMLYLDKDIPYIPELLLSFGLLLKSNFRFKNKILNKQYVLDVLTGKKELDKTILRDILEYLRDEIRRYQRKIYKTIYKAIEDRNEKV